MPFSRRQFLHLAAGAAATAGLSACAIPKRPTAAPTGTQGTTQAALAKDALDVWYHAYTELGTHDAVDRFARDYPQAKVSVKWAEGDYPKLVAEALASAAPPAVFEYPNGPSLAMIASGQVADLTDLVAGVEQDFWAPLLARLTFQGKVWSIPQAVSMQFIYYRKSLLAGASLKPPTTLAELIATAKALKTGARGGFFAGNDGGISTVGPLLPWAAGLDQLDSKRSQAGFNAQPLYDAAAAWGAFYASGDLLTTASTDWYDATPFATGETAMQWGGIWSLPQVIATLGEDFGIIPFPAAGASGKPVVPFGAFASCVSAKGNSVAAAKEYVKWLWVDEADKQLEFATSYGTNIPARQSLLPKAEAFSAPPGSDAAACIKNFGRVDDIYWTPGCASAYTQALANVVTGKADPKTEFTAAATTVAAELAKQPR